MKSKLLLIFLCLFLITGCTEPLKKGIVVDKVHEEGWTEVRFNVVLKIPETVDHPDSWYLVIRGVNSEGETVNESFYVSKAVYDSADIGDTWVR